MREQMNDQQIKNLIYLFEEFSKDEYAEMNIENYINYLRKQNMELLEYINFEKICTDNNLKTGDLTFTQTLELENILQRFINQNK